MPNVCFDIKRATKNRTGRKSMRKRLTVNKDEWGERKGERRESIWKW